MITLDIQMWAAYLQRDADHHDLQQDNTIVMDNEIFWCGAGEPPTHLASFRRVDESPEALRMYYALRELEKQLESFE